jgi:hypothetical protein
MPGVEPSLDFAKDLTFSGRLLSLGTHFTTVAEDLKVTGESNSGARRRLTWATRRA